MHETRAQGTDKPESSYWRYEQMSNRLDTYTLVGLSVNGCRLTARRRFGLTIFCIIIIIMIRRSSWRFGLSTFVCEPASYVVVHRWGSIEIRRVHSLLAVAVASLPATIVTITSIASVPDYLLCRSACFCGALTSGWLLNFRPPANQLCMCVWQIPATPNNERYVRSGCFFFYPTLHIFIYNAQDATYSMYVLTGWAELSWALLIFTICASVAECLFGNRLTSDWTLTECGGSIEHFFFTSYICLGKVAMSILVGTIKLCHFNRRRIHREDVESTSSGPLFSWSCLAVVVLLFGRKAGVLD